jgi:hypothetical protein
MKGHALLRRSAALALAAGALALPGVASAGTLTADAVCYGTGVSARLSGTGYTPNLSLAFLGGSGDTSTYTDENGAFSDWDVGLPANNSFTPRQVTLSTQDQVDASRNASVTVMTVRSGSNLPIHGKAAATVLWQFGGFPTGATIYGHFRYAHNGPFRTVKDVRFGTAQGPCGTLAKRAKRIPVNHPKHGGGWYLQVDTKPKYSSSTEPEYDITFSVR